MTLSPAMNTAATVGGATDSVGRPCGPIRPGEKADRPYQPALAINSTPLPFQRNFTTLGRPMPPE